MALACLRIASADAPPKPARNAVVQLEVSGGKKLLFDAEAKINVEWVNGVLNACLTSKDGMLLQVNGMAMPPEGKDADGAPETVRVVLMNTPLQDEAFVGGKADLSKLSLKLPKGKDEAGAWRVLECQGTLKAEGKPTTVSVSVRAPIPAPPGQRLIESNR